jgi:hypothetical protein
METLVVKPRFRFMGRSAGRYYWEPVNDEARAYMMTAEGSTAVRWFWGDRFGMDVAVAAHDRAGELGMTPREYRDHVKGLAAETRAAALSAPLITREEMDRELSRYLSADASPITREEAGEHFPHLSEHEVREMTRGAVDTLTRDLPTTPYNWTGLRGPATTLGARTNLLPNPYFDGARQYAAGGAELTFTRAAGGVIPSPVPAPDAIKLSEGSYRVPESTLRRYGRAFLDRLNGGRA